MNNDGTASMLGDTSAINAQLTTILGLLNKKASLEENIKPGVLKSLQDSLFPDAKAEKTQYRRLKQKEKVFQAVPVAIDSITPDGRKEIKRALSNIFSFDIDMERPSAKSGPWGKLFMALAFLFGFLVGAIGQVLKDLKNVFKFIGVKIKGWFNIIKNTKIGKALTGIFSNIRLKFLNVIRRLKNLSIVKYVTGFIKELGTSLKTSFTRVVEVGKSLFNAVGKRVASIFAFVKNILSKVSNFFKPVIGFLSKFKSVGKVISGPGKLISSFMGFFGKISKFFTLGLKVGRLFGKILGPVAVLFELGSGLFKAFTDTKLSDKSFVQKLITGIVGGIGGFFDLFSIFGLEFFNFDEMRDRIEKIFKPFREGRWLAGLGQIVNQIVSWILAVPGKILGWVVGWFNKDLGKKITEYYRNFDYFEWLKSVFGTIFGWIKGIFSFVPKISSWIVKIYDNIKNTVKSMFEKITGFVKNITDFISELFNFSKIKDWIKSKLGLGGESKESERKSVTVPVGDLSTTNDRTLYTKRGAYSFDKNDEILAMKKDGPISDILARTSAETNRALVGIDDSVRKINDAFDKFVKAATTMQQNELKLMNENILLLRDIKNKESNSSVVVQNNSNSNIFSEKISSNIDFRRNLAYYRGNIP